MTPLWIAVSAAVADAAGGPPTIYLIDGEPRPAQVTDEHLATAGIDAGTCAASRWRCGASASTSRRRAALEGNEAVTVQTPDGGGGSRLWLPSEALREEETPLASAPAPAPLPIAADRGTLDAALAATGEPAQPLPPATFRVTAGGLRTES